MAGTNLNFPYDAEIFNYDWKNTPDMILTTMITSGAVMQDSEIARMISNGSNLFTVPFYDVMTSTEIVYNGVNNFSLGELAGGTYSGVVYGRMAGWAAKSFIKDFNSGADPMAQIVAGVAAFWQKARQTRLLGILNAIFAITGDADWDLHKTKLAVAGKAQSAKFSITTAADTSGNATVTVTAAGMTGSPKAITVALLNTDTTAAGVATKVRTALSGDAAVAAMFTVGGTSAEIILTKKAIAPFDSTLKIEYAGGTTNSAAGASVDNTEAVTIEAANQVGATSINDTIVAANGDAAGGYSLAIMHSVVANRLAGLQLLEFSKYTDAAGITKALPIGQINGITVIVNDGVPVAQSPVEGKKEYTTYLLGNGAIRYATAPVDVPSEMDRDPSTNGGVDMIYTRIRECLHPWGFSFKGSATADVGVPDATLFAAASYERKMPAKAINMARLITNG